MDNDKISRQALLDEINEEIEYGEEHFRPENEQINKGLKIARKLVRAAPSVDNGWISVEERLPEIGEHYRSKLVMCYSPDEEHEFLFDYYEVNGFGQGCFTAEKYFGITITHWQPLPEPPKGECK